MSKTVWPVATCESVFFPEFKVWNSTDQKKYKVGILGKYSKLLSNQPNVAEEYFRVIQIRPRCKSTAGLVIMMLK